MNEQSQLATIAESQVDLASEWSTWRYSRYVIGAETPDVARRKRRMGPSTNDVPPGTAGENFLGRPLTLPSKVIRLATDFSPRVLFQLLQQWEGTVIAVSGDDITAELRDLTDASKPRESAVFSLEEITEEDRRLIARGAIFYWSIGYERTRFAGQKKTVSLIRFRRLPAWSRSDLVAVRRGTEALAEFFGSVPVAHDATGR